MYERINEHSHAAAMQTAVQEKMRATHIEDRRSAGYLGASLPGGVQQAPQETPLLDVEYDRLVQSTLELDQSVQWLLQRIQPICQPPQVGNAIEGAGQRDPEPPTSELRLKLQKLRGIVEAISSRIAEVRYTIEV